MKERPILFSAPMVRALLDGGKTQTRRVMKPPPDPDQRPALVIGSTGFHYVFDNSPLSYPPKRRIRWDCPYGQPGDRLWVRETWLMTNPFTAGGFHTYGYRATDAAEFPDAIWKPSIHMPRVASRITLEVTGVRVERLQDICAYDCWAEGIPGMPPAGVYIERVDEWARWSDGVMRDHPKAAYSDLWNSINGHGSWELNPWVWVVSFKIVKP